MKRWDGAGNDLGFTGSQCELANNDVPGFRTAFLWQALTLNEEYSFQPASLFYR
jgi:hypothetical protein